MATGLRCPDNTFQVGGDQQTWDWFMSRWRIVKATMEMVGNQLVKELIDEDFLANLVQDERTDKTLL